MKMTVKAGKWSSKDIETLIVPMGENESVPKGLPTVAEQLIKDAIKRKDFSGKKKQIISFSLPAGRQSLRQVFFIGFGKDKNVKIREFGEVIGQCIRQAQTMKMTKVGFWFRDALAEGLGEVEHVAQSVTEYAGLASYEYQAYLKKKKTQIKNLDIFVENKEELTAVKHGSDIGHKIAQITNDSRELANKPSNELTPKYFAEYVKQIGLENKKLYVKVLGEKEMERLGMGAILGVSRGSAQEAQFMIVEYWGADRKEQPYVMVGKGVTFDTGGISIKPSMSMDEMKFDMCGAAAALAIVRIASALNLKLNVVALMPAAENMPGQNAYKPGDVLTAKDGTTIEVIDTDAEGRLLLADALVYARDYKPKAVIDLATLTGACMVALYNFAAGLFTKNEDMAKEFALASESTGDTAWHLPMPSEAQEYVKSSVADVRNLATVRWGGAITAAAFLNHFVAGKYPWVHLDIAGVAWNANGSKHLAPGSSGGGVRIVTEWLRAQAKKQNLVV